MSRSIQLDFMIIDVSLCWKHPGYVRWMYVYSLIFCSVCNLVNDAQLASDSGEGLDGSVDVVERMSRRDLHANACLPLGHDRVTESDHVDPSTCQFVDGSIQFDIFGTRIETNVIYRACVPPSWLPTWRHPRKPGKSDDFRPKSGNQQLSFRCGNGSCWPLLFVANQFRW